MLSFFIAFLFFLPFPCFPQAVDLGRIIVANTGAIDYSENTEVFSLDTIEDLPLFSSEQILSYSPSVDLRRNVPSGTVQDLSLRGSLFEDNTIEVSGIAINDPQTGHFSLQLPLTSADIERVVVSPNAQKVNFIPKKPQGRGAYIESSLGEHALWQELISINFSLNSIHARLSAERFTSSGSAQDTDVTVKKFSFHSLWEDASGSIESLFGFSRKDFGADGFYAESYPFEEEHLDQRFFLLRTGIKGCSFDADSTIFFRRHSDRFILNRNEPYFYVNHHTTYVRGLTGKIAFDNDSFVSLGIEQEMITSTHLGGHRRLKRGFELGVKEKRIDNFIFSFTAGLDYYETWRYLDVIHCGLGYYLNKNILLRFAFDKIWRAPSFTELYYLSPANIGNPGLNIQRTYNFEWGLEYSFRENMRAGCALFTRRQRGTIDWVKNISSAAWTAENVGNLNVRGIDLFFSYISKNSLFDGLTLGYTYLDIGKDNPYCFSKYVFDSNRHKFVGMLRLHAAGISADVIASFFVPQERKRYTTIDFQVKKQYEHVTVMLEGINLFDKEYCQAGAIVGPGRWIKLVFRYSF